MKALNIKLSCVFILLVGLSILLLINKEPTMLYIKSILEWKRLNTALWLGFFCCFTVHYLSIKNDESYNGGLIFKHFGKFADSGFAMITYGLASTTSAAILKGVYIQQYFEEKVYFNNFDQVDIYSMLVVCLFLLGYSIFAALSALRNALLFTQAETAIPIKD
jgi:hypothetical protein